VANFASSLVLLVIQLRYLQGHLVSKSVTGYVAYIVSLGFCLWAVLAINTHDSSWKNQQPYFFAAGPFIDRIFACGKPSPYKQTCVDSTKLVAVAVLLIHIDSCKEWKLMFSESDSSCDIMEEPCVKWRDCLFGRSVARTRCAAQHVVCMSLSRRVQRREPKSTMCGTGMNEWSI
jgi:hypothetical protein